MMIKETVNKKYIAYDGQRIRIEWYFDGRGRSEAHEYFQQLLDERKKKIAHLFILMGDHGKIHSTEKFCHEGDQVYVFKTKIDRFFCFFCEGSRVIITNAYEKKSNKMPPGEKERAIKAKTDYKTRCMEKEYYD